MTKELYDNLKSLDGVKDELKLQIHLLDAETRQEFENMNAEYERAHSKIFTIDNKGQIHPSMSLEAQELYDKLSKGYAKVKSHILRKAA